MNALLTYAPPAATIALIAASTVLTWSIARYKVTKHFERDVYKEGKFSKELREEFLRTKVLDRKNSRGWMSVGIFAAVTIVGLFVYLTDHTIKLSARVQADQEKLVFTQELLAREQTRSADEQARLATITAILTKHSELANKLLALIPVHAQGQLLLLSDYYEVETIRSRHHLLIDRIASGRDIDQEGPLGQARAVYNAWIKKWEVQRQFGPSWADKHAKENLNGINTMRKTIDNLLSKKDLNDGEMMVLLATVPQMQSVILSVDLRGRLIVLESQLTDTKKVRESLEGALQETKQETKN